MVTVADVSVPGDAPAGSDSRAALLCEVFADVLGLARVGADDDFFAIGGHSLLAARLTSQVRETLGVELELLSVFEHPTPASLAPVLDTGRHTGRSPLRPVRRRELMPTSFAQERMWLIGELEGPSTTSNTSLALRLHGDLDAGALRAALGDVVARHEVLRTVYLPSVDGPVQRILPARAVETVLRVTDTTEAGLEAELAGAAGHVFDVESEIPLRGNLFRLSAREHVLLVLVHHIASDGWSAGPLLADLGTAYEARRAGGAPGWAPLPVQYADYAVWQRALLGESSDPESLQARQLHYWRHTLDGAPQELALPADRPRPPVASRRGRTLRFALDPALHARLTGCARAGGATLFMVLHAGLVALLSALGAGPDVPIGSAVAGRTDAALDRLVGFFVNTLVLRADASGDPSFAELLRRVREADLSAFAHQDVGFQTVVEHLNPERSPGRNPLFQVMLLLQNTARATLRIPGVRAQAVTLDEFNTTFDLSFVLTEELGPDGGPAGVRAALTYATDLFDASTAEHLADTYVRALDTLTAHPGLRIGDLRRVTGTGG